MAKRNIKEEILSLKQRNEFESPNFSRLYDLKAIIDVLQSNSDKEIDEFFKYIPIAVVASIEAFSRASIKSLIDFGSPYVENSEALFNRTIQKLDFEIFLSVQNKIFSIGELLSHLVSCNNITDLETSLTSIMGVGLFSALEKHEMIIGGLYDEEKTFLYRSSIVSIKKSIVRTFENRHIFCHESNKNSKIDRSQIVEDFVNCLLFLEMASDFVLSVLYEDWQMTVAEKVSCLNTKVIDSEVKLSEKLKAIEKERLSITENKKDFKKLFRATIRSWKIFSDKKAQLKSSYSSSYIWSEYIYLQDKLESLERFTNEIY